MSLESKIDALVVTINDLKVDVKSMKGDIHKINRGMYGDEDNLVDGLIRRQLNDEIRISRLESHKKKAMWMIGGFVVAVEAMLFILKATNVL